MISNAIKKEVAERLKSALIDNIKCWSYMLRVRGSALCAICSGRSEDFFTEAKDKIFVSPETCLLAVTSCEGIFNTLAWIAENTDRIMKEAAVDSTESKTSKLGALFEKLNTYSPPQELAHVFRDYSLQKKDGKTSGFHAARVCAQIMNIREKPYVLVMDDAGIERLTDATVKNKYKELEKTLAEVNEKRIVKLNLEQNLYIELLLSLTKEHQDRVRQLKEMSGKEEGILLKELDDENKDFTKRQERLLKDKIERCAAIHKSMDDEYQKISKLNQNKIDERNKEILQTKNNWISTLAKKIATSRELHSVKHVKLLSAPAPVFHADSSVLLKQTDSMFTAFDGAPGTTLAMNGVWRAINCSVTFP